GMEAEVARIKVQAHNSPCCRADLAHCALHPLPAVCIRHPALKQVFHRSEGTQKDVLRPIVFRRGKGLNSSLQNHDRVVAIPLYKSLSRSMDFGVCNCQTEVPPIAILCGQ
ncbi:MAG: hypothetical protein KAR22_11755, partial [Gammaproteobacteria bacterium]|nr:hypothetical protein [Gammaproteobacteria bacterium]